jgi:hypothetical protein
MSFLKLRGFVLNTRYIHHIKISPDNYDIHMKGNMKGLVMFGSGSLSENYDSFVVSKEKHTEDYDKVKKWLSNLDN